MVDSTKNIVPNGNFQEGKLGSLPDKWEECEPVPSRNVKVACVSGCASLKTWQRVPDFAGENHADIALLPETFYHSFTHLPKLRNVEGYDGPSCTLLSTQARKYNMYVAGTFIYRDETEMTFAQNDKDKLLEKVAHEKNTGK